MSGLLVALGLLVGVLAVARLLHTGHSRLVPVAALTVGALLLTTPFGRELRAWIGDGLLLAVQLVAWVVAPLVVAGLLVRAMVSLGRRQPGHPGSPARLATLALTVLLGLVVCLLVARLASAATPPLRAAADTATAYVVSAAVVVLAPDP